MVVFPVDYGIAPRGIEQRGGKGERRKAGGGLWHEMANFWKHTQCLFGLWICEPDGGGRLSCGDPCLLFRVLGAFGPPIFKKDAAAVSVAHIEAFGFDDRCFQRFGRDLVEYCPVAVACSVESLDAGRNIGEPVFNCSHGRIALFST